MSSKPSPAERGGELRERLIALFDAAVERAHDTEEACQHSDRWHNDDICKGCLRDALAALAFPEPLSSQQRDAKEP